MTTAPQVDLHSWGGRLHPVSEPFELKVDTVKCYWDCYFWGDGSSVAYRNLHGYDLNRVGASNLSRANKVVKFLLEVGEKPENFQPVDLQDSDDCFNACFECMCGVLRLSVRACDLNVLTAYNCMQAFQK